VAREPHLIWNAFVDFLAMEDDCALTPTQRSVQLAFWYDSEVQNGGHGQFLENRGTDRLQDTIAALKELGLSCQAAVLSDLAAELSRGTPEAAWSDTLSPATTNTADAAYHACSPSVPEALELHLAAHQAEYVELV
jgi:hypothetical protein